MLWRESPINAIAVIPPGRNRLQIADCRSVIYGLRVPRPDCSCDRAQYEGIADVSNRSDRTLEEVLQSTSDTLFPADLGARTVTLQSTDCDGDTPLHVLIWRGDTSGARLLIENGANPNAVGDMGETPLHVAIRKENLSLVRALLRAGARTNIVSEFGQSASALASEKGLDL